MTVGDRIKLRRIELGLTQDQLAKRLGYNDRSAVCRVESAGDSLSNRRVLKIAKALNTSAAYLYGWFEDSDEPQEPEALILTEEENKIVLAYREKSPAEKEAFKTLLGIKGEDS